MYSDTKVGPYDARENTVFNENEYPVFRGLADSAWF
jgi:hypothetical protein